MTKLNNEKEPEMTSIATISVPSAAAPCVVAVSKTEAAKIQKSVNDAAKFLGVGKKTKTKRASSKPAEPRAKRAPKPSSKQGRVNALVQGVFEGRDPKTLTKEFKKEIIAEIMQLCDMTQAGATTYFYNAIKTL